MGAMILIQIVPPYALELISKHRIPNVHLVNMTQGIDAEKEVSKLAGKKAELQKQILWLRKCMDSPDYTAKVPPKVQEADAAKLKQSKTELQKAEKAIENFKKMI